MPTSRKRSKLKLKTKKQRSTVKRKKRSRSKHKMSPIGWVVIGSVVLGAGTALVLRRRRRGRKSSEDKTVFLPTNPEAAKALQDPFDLGKATEYVMLTDPTPTHNPRFHVK